ncbi:hypothetical protein [Staphylococcus epidermidis]|uniref:hypothetical protein n=1 Tax=Staphylococcus epidermidis TaxID=1282 RepID=UPI001FD420D8|nr:hypothetical protein [Staphylococcus epidermidis]UOQ64203.1 hypothetical protein MUW37_09180 [Staphylococcus epidermidis]
MGLHKSIYWHLYLQYFVLLARFLRGQLQPVVFSLSCSLKSLAKILLKNKALSYNLININKLN